HTLQKFPSLFKKVNKQMPCTASAYLSWRCIFKEDLMISVLLFSLFRRTLCKKVPQKIKNHII
ncbi:MAG: hypothetical protein IKH87_02215, partial [Firmicutes bacterium]|nr:hypothetical protein [Bacillota bacterium]